MTLLDDASPVSTSPSPPAAAVPYPPAPYAWFVVGSLALINMVSYIERQIPTLLFGPIKKDFGLSDTQVSLLAGIAFVIFYVGFGLIIGRLADRMSRKRIIAVGVVLWSLATMSCGLARSFAQLFTSRVLVGVGEATLAPSANSMLSDYFPRERLTRALGFYTGAQYLGAGFALIVGGLAIQIVSAMPPPVLPLIGRIAPWQTTFLAVGLFGSLVLVPFAFVREPLRRGIAQVHGESFATLIAFIRLNWRTLAAHFSAYSISSTLGFGTVAWIPTYFVRVHHWSVHDIGYLYGMMLAFLVAAGVLAGAQFGEWLGERGYKDFCFRAPMITMPITAIPAALAPLMSDVHWSIGLLAVSTFLNSFPVALTYAALQTVTPNRLRGQIISLFMFTANILGVGLGPTVVALITDHVYHNEAMVGASIATATVIIIPIVVLLLGWGLRPLRESLARADVFSRNI